MNQVSCPYATKQSLYEWSSAVFAPAKAEAQSVNVYGDLSAEVVPVSQNNIGSQTETVQHTLPLPVGLLLFLFIIFTVVMSAVYVYHWVSFNLGDSFVKNAVFVYFAGLALLLTPLVYFIL